MMFKLIPCIYNDRHTKLKACNNVLLHPFTMNGCNNTGTNCKQRTMV